MQAWLLARQSSATYGGGGERSTSTADASTSDQRHSDDEEHDGTGLDGAFNGRINKTGDSCYSFWCGASLAVSKDDRLPAPTTTCSADLALFASLADSRLIPLDRRKSRRDTPPSIADSRRRNTKDGSGSSRCHALVPQSCCPRFACSRARGRWQSW